MPRMTKSVSLDMDLAQKISAKVEDGLFRDFSSFVNYSLSKTLAEMENE